MGNKISEYTDPNLAYDVFEHEITKLFFNSFPLATLSKKASRDQLWIIRGLKISSAHKNCLYSKWLWNKTHQNELHYKSYKKILEQTATAAELLYYNNLFS